MQVRVASQIEDRAAALGPQPRRTRLDRVGAEPQPAPKPSASATHPAYVSATGRDNGGALTPLVSQGHYEAVRIYRALTTP